MEQIKNNKEYKEYQQLEKELKSEKEMKMIKDALFKQITENNIDSTDKQAKIEQKYQGTDKKEVLEEEVQRARKKNKTLWEAYQVTAMENVTKIEKFQALKVKIKN